MKAASFPARSEKAVKPTISVKSMVTCLRSASKQILPVSGPLCLDVALSATSFNSSLNHVIGWRRKRNAGKDLAIIGACAAKSRTMR